MNDIKIYFLLFIIYSVLGWIVEVIATYPNTKCFVNRGFLIGPYCPIYGFCAILMILSLNNFNNSVILFIMAIVICSFVEYITSYLMEKIFKARWWDYSKKKFNINGRICLINSLAFGILGFILVNYVNPIIFNYLNNLKYLNVIYYLSLTIFIIDFIISFKVVFKVKNMSLKYVHLDNTKEITDKVKKILSDNFLSQRLFKAFPNIKLIFKSIGDKIRKQN